MPIVKSKRYIMEFISFLLILKMLIKQKTEFL